MSRRPRLALVWGGLLLVTIMGQPSPATAAAPNRHVSMQLIGAAGACGLVTSTDLATINVDAAHGEVSTTPTTDGTTSGCLVTAVNPNSTPNQQGQRQVLLRLFRAAIARDVPADQEDTFVQTVLLPSLHPDVAEVVSDIGSGTDHAMSFVKHFPEQYVGEPNYANFTLRFLVGSTSIALSMTTDAFGTDAAARAFLIALAQRAIGNLPPVGAFPCPAIVQAQSILGLQDAQRLSGLIDSQVRFDEQNRVVPFGTADTVAVLNLSVVAGLAIVDQTAAPADFFSTLKTGVDQALAATLLMQTMTTHAADLSAALLLLNSAVGDGATAVGLNDPACGAA
jgi:hypothetical protein